MNVKYKLYSFLGILMCLTVTSACNDKDNTDKNNTDTNPQQTAVSELIEKAGRIAALPEKNTVILLDEKSRINWKNIGMISQD